MGTWEWQITGDEGSWSDKSREIFGLGALPRDFTLEDVSRAAEPGGPAGRGQGGRQAVEEGVPYETEFRITRPNGEIRWVLAKGKAMFDNLGRPVRLLGVNADVTERKLATPRSASGRAATRPRSSPATSCSTIGIPTPTT